MKIDIKQVTDTNVSFVLYSPISFANSLRRILLSEVSSTSIDIVEILENGTVIPDEMLSNRLGLIPIYHTHNILSKTECDCDSYCTRCSIKFFLKRTNSSDETISITGKDLITDKPGVVCHNSLIVKLAPGRTVDITCIARKGIPTAHAKYCPVTAVEFTYDRENKHRDTSAFPDENNEPVVKQSEEVVWDDIEEIEMNVEVLEDVGKPLDILLKALGVYRDKMQNILNGIH